MKLKIAQVAPLYEAVPPKLYGGTERVVSYLTESLVEKGHEVTLFASGDSVTKAHLKAITERALRLDDCSDPLAIHQILLKAVIDHSTLFDIWHFHIDYLHFPVSKVLKIPNLTTLHGRLDLPALPLLYNCYNDMPLVSISDDQRKPLPMANWLKTVYHGLPLHLYNYGEGRGGYLLFLGRISPEKGPDKAIEIAINTNKKLIIAAKIDKADKKYFEAEIKPLLNHPLIEFIGEVDEQQKKVLLENAAALLFPIDWPEPFGMVMIEALAAGTPVIAFKKGSVPEILQHGKTGFIVETVSEAIDAVAHLYQINRLVCRHEFEKRFTASIMADNYLELYEQIHVRHKYETMNFPTA
ncbi:glycosyltransferase family 4 protein [Gynurincola endophyticus]|uniref:glycosyltransferase family 4 protein n=1 Tax=Gynurincola endophyticus TaxID=2479004 RepID=UPI0018F4B9C0|nr:glycosyltransferase family 4 protein [Gynurincola endophyticus]